MQKADFPEEEAEDCASLWQDTLMQVTGSPALCDPCHVQTMAQAVLRALFQVTVLRHIFHSLL